MKKKSLLYFLKKRNEFTKILRIMRLITIMMIIGIFQVNASVYSQNEVFSFKESGLTMRSVLKTIESQSKFKFFLNDDLTNVDKMVDLKTKNLTIDQVLDDVLAGTNLSYKILDNNLVIISPTVLLQQKKISGVITDVNTGQPLVGVNVKIQGTNRGTVTDFNGKYSIDVTSSNVVIVYTYMGYLPETISVSGMSNFDIKLKPDVKNLDEVVVVGYGTQRKKDLTGSVSSVSSNELKNLPVSRVDQMLQGRSAGVEVKSIDGAPGSGTTVRIRGSRSINASNEPLYVIDGVIGEVNLNSINPNDIESIDILKDASAIAIYGSRGSNGVVLVTTKKGKEGNIINFSATHGIQSLNKSRKPKMMNAKDFAVFENESRATANLAPLYTQAAIDTMGKGTDWIDASTRIAPYSNYNIAFSGGKDGMTYYLSGSMVDQQGIVLNSGYKRYQVRMNVDKTFNSWFKIGTNFNISRDRTDATTVELGSNLGWQKNMYTLPPTMPVYNTDGSLNAYNPINYSGGYVNTPVAQSLVSLFTRSNNLQGNFYAELGITKGLKLKSTFGTVLYSDRYNYYEPSYMPLKIAQNTQTGNASAQSAYNSYLLNENVLTYNKEINDHHFNVIGGATYQYKEREMVYASGTGLTDDILQYNNLSVTNQSMKGVNSSYNNNTMISFLGRINYDYKGKYYVTATSRYDGASNFAKDKKWGFFPSFALKWNASEEEFFKKSALSKIVNKLALRGSYGISGNQGISDYQSLPSLSSTSTGYIFGQGNTSLAFSQGNLANKNLTWETTAQKDLGLELGLFKGKINIEADYYDMKTRDLLLTVQIPSQTGYGSRLINLGKTMSRGFDFQVSTNIINTKNFTWKTDISISTNKDKVLDLGPLVRVLLDNNNYGAYTNYLAVGVPIGANFGATYAGVWQTQEEINAETAKSAGHREFVSKSGFYKPGRPKYIDVDHDGLLTDAGDYQCLGTTNPTFFGGIGNSMRYKNLSFDFFIQYSGGNTMYNDLEFFTGSGMYLTNQLAYIVDRWTPTNTNTNIPSVDSRDNIPSTRLLHDASFIRLKSVRLSYSINNALFKKYVKSCEVFLTGTNLLLFSKYNGYDPEVNKGGTSSTVRAKDDGTYPNARMTAIGVNISF